MRTSVSIICSASLLFAACAARVEPIDGSTIVSSAASSIVFEQPEIIHFARLHASFRFSGVLPDGWEVEYVPATQALNLYDPSAGGTTNLEKSQIFVRTFTAGGFLTLSTVTIHDREELSVHGHAAVRYDIEKKASVAPFASQPTWRSARHGVTDIRFAGTNPSLFFVIARRPDLDARVFEQFLENLAFHNDNEHMRLPLPRAQERVTKKPFGIRITPATSPVQPERFSGFHIGTDFETFADEQNTEVEVTAICGGAIRQKRTADGYGGVLVQECMRGDSTITVIYGHLDSVSVQGTVGEYLSPGDRVGLLGEGGTAETDFERKHLHLGIHRGTAVDIRGYVQTEAETSAWIDPMTVIPLAPL